MHGDERTAAPGGPGPAPAPPPLPEFTAGSLVATAARTLADHWPRVLVPAVVVFGLSAVADTLVVEWDRSLTHWEGVAVIVLQAFSSLGLTFYAGLLDRLVGAVGEGNEPPGVRAVLLTLPYGRLVVADLLLWLVEIVSTATLVLPGMILFTFFAIVGPLINMEDHGVFRAFADSTRLVRPHFLVVLLLVTVPLAVEHELLAVLEDKVPWTGPFTLFATEFAVGLLFGMTVGLVEVVIAEALMRRRRYRLLTGSEHGTVVSHEDGPLAP